MTDEVVSALEATVAISPQVVADALGPGGTHCSERDSPTSSLNGFMPTINRLYNTNVIMRDIIDAV